MDKPVVIIGANGLGRVALDIFHSNDVMMYCFLDEDEQKFGKEIDTVTVVGSPDDEALFGLIGETVDVFLATDDTDVKKDYIKRIKKERKTMPVNAIHKNTYISSTSKIGHGNLINSGASINAFADLGNHCLVHSGAIIDFETVIGDYAQIGVGATVSSGVQIEEGAFIGAGAIVVSGIKIGKGARVGAGSVVVADVKAGATVFGNPAKPV